MNAAVEYLESQEYLEGYRSNRYSPRVHHSEYENASVITCGGVVAQRPMFELIEDHESANEHDVCYLCSEGIVV